MSDPLCFTVLTIEDDGHRIAGKRFRRGRFRADTFNLGTRFQAAEREFSAAMLDAMRNDHLRCLCLGRATNDDPEAWVVRRKGETFVPTPRLWMPVDVDDFPPDELINPIWDGESAALVVVDRLGLRGVRCVWHITSSHGLMIAKREGDEPTLRVGVRLFIRLSSPLDTVAMRRLAKRRWGKDLVDLSIYDPERVLYSCDPKFIGIDDPMRGRARVGEFDGEPLEVDEAAGSDEWRERDDGSERRDEDPTLEAIRAQGLYREDMGDGKHWIVCPWEEEHTTPASRGDTVYYEGGTGGHALAGFKCLHGHCEGRTVRDLRRELGVKERGYAGWVYVHMQKRFWNEVTRRLVDRDVFDSYNARGERAKPHQAFFANASALKVDDMEFAPGRDRVFRRDGLLILNTYVDRRIAPDESISSAPWVDHLAWLVPDERDRERLMDWLAWCYQHPEQKITWAPILYSRAHGVGKTTVFNCLGECIGNLYVSEPTQAELEDKFNDWCYGKLLVKIEELRSGDRFNVAEKLKPVVANPTVSVRRMHETGFRVRNTANVCASTNHMQALPIDPSDRRYMLIQCVEAGRAKREKHMRDFHRWLGEVGYGGIAAWLAERDVSKFVPTSEAPVTKLKQVVAEASKTDLDRAVDLCDVFDEHKVIISSNVAEYLRQNDCQIRENRLGLIAAARGWKGQGTRVLVGHQKVTVWGEPLAVRAFVAKRPSEREKARSDLWSLLNKKVSSDV